MDRQLYQRRVMGLMGALLLVTACAGPTPQPPPESESTGTTAAPSASMTATPDPCTGWNCTLEGVVYLGAVGPDNAVAGTPVELSHVSYCSPTRGLHKTTTGPEGSFSFEVYLHDTDTFFIQVERDEYEPVRRSVGGFDCLYCACPPLEIVLQPQGTPAAAPFWVNLDHAWRGVRHPQMPIRPATHARR